MESLKQLSRALEKAARIKRVEVPTLFTDPLGQPRLHEKDESFLSLVFAGEGLRSFASPENFRASTRYIIWVLSTPAKKILCDFLELPSEAVGLFPRQSLFPKNTKEASFGDAKSLIIVGRNREGKNLLLSLAWASELQKIFPFDVYVLGKETKELEETSKELDWKKRPLFRGDLGSDWTLCGAPSPIVISLSLYPFEDFSVIASESQLRGFPLVLSNWFAHQDVVGKNVLHINSDDIRNQHLPTMTERFLDFYSARTLGHEWEQTHTNLRPVALRGDFIQKKIESMNSSKRAELFHFFKDSSAYFGENAFQNNPQSFPNVIQILEDG